MSPERSEPLRTVWHPQGWSSELPYVMWEDSDTPVLPKPALALLEPNLNLTCFSCRYCTALLEPVFAARLSGYILILIPWLFILCFLSSPSPLLHSNTFFHFYHSLYPHHLFAPSFPLFFICTGSLLCSFPLMSLLFPPSVVLLFPFVPSHSSKPFHSPCFLLGLSAHSSQKSFNSFPHLHPTWYRTLPI